MSVIRRYQGALLPILVILVTTTAGCSTSLTAEPGTVGGAIDALDRAAQEHDVESFAAHWDFESVGTMYEQESAEIADKLWMDAIDDAEITDEELAQRAYYPEDVATTRDSMDAAIQTFVAAGPEDPGRGMLALISLKNVVRARVRRDTARVTFRLEGHVPEELVLELWRVVDNGEEKWIVSRICNAKEIATSQAAF